MLSNWSHRLRNMTTLPRLASVGSECLGTILLLCDDLLNPTRTHCPGLLFAHSSHAHIFCTSPAMAFSPAHPAPYVTPFKGVPCPAGTVETTNQAKGGAANKALQSERRRLYAGALEARRYRLGGTWIHVYDQGKRPRIPHLHYGFKGTVFDHHTGAPPRVPARADLAVARCG